VSARAAPTPHKIAAAITIRNFDANAFRRPGRVDLVRPDSVLGIPGLHRRIQPRIIPGKPPDNEDFFCLFSCQIMAHPWVKIRLTQRPSADSALPRHCIACAEALIVSPAMEKAKPDIDLEVFLMQRTGQGDRGSFEQLYERFSGVLFSTALNVLGNQEAAEDVLQDVFVAIWEKAPLYDSVRGKPLTWAVTLTRYKAIDRLRSLQRKGLLHDRIEQETKIFEEHTGRTSLDEVDASEKSKIVREAIELAFFDGLTQAEIAKKLRQPLGTVKARIRRGMLKLREIITPSL
jgi:RNA polymerase sigma-70 factor (ECF subfamily)